MDIKLNAAPGQVVATATLLQILSQKLAAYGVAPRILSGTLHFYRNRSGAGSKASKSQSPRLNRYCIDLDPRARTVTVTGEHPYIIVPEIPAGEELVIEASELFPKQAMQA